MHVEVSEMAQAASLETAEHDLPGENAALIGIPWKTHMGSQQGHSYGH